MVKLHCFCPEKKKKKTRDQESGQSSLTRAQERLIAGTAPVQLTPAVSSRLQNKQPQHFSGMDARVVHQGLRQTSRSLNTESA